MDENTSQTPDGPVPGAAPETPAAGQPRRSGRHAAKKSTASKSALSNVPVFQEAGSIGPALRRLPAGLIGHVLVVDGGSTDGTVEEALESLLREVSSIIQRKVDHQFDAH